MTDGSNVYDENIYLVKFSPELISLTLGLNNFVPYNETIYIQAPENYYAETIYLVKSTPELISLTLTISALPFSVVDFNEIITLSKTSITEYDEQILLEVIIQYDENLVIESTSRYNETIILSKTSTVIYDEKILLEVIYPYNETIFLHKTKSYDEKIFLWRSAINSFDETIILNKVSSNLFDENIVVTYTNPQQFLEFDSTIFLLINFPELISLTLTLTEKLTVDYNETIVLMNSTLVTYDERLDIQSTNKYDETITLAYANTTNKYDGKIILIKSNTSLYNNIIYLTKTTDAVNFYNNRITLSQSISGGGGGVGWHRFDETILLQRHPVCQVGDVVRDSRGRAIGIITGGIDFSE